MYWDSNEDMGTPSAPPIMDIGEDDNIVELEKEIEQIEDEICREAGVESHHQQVNIGCIAGDTVSHLYPEFSGRYASSFLFLFCGEVLMC